MILNSASFFAGINGAYSWLARSGRSKKFTGRAGLSEVNGVMRLMHVNALLLPTWTL